jgi:Holliday junction resolvase RusA-like endonuclease
VFEGAVKVTAIFYLPKAKSVRAEYPINQRSGDLDKYLRALLDSVTKAGAWVDDSLVVEVEAYKLYATGEPGVAVTIKSL